MIKAFLAVFASVFLAEIGDKTQLATIGFTAGGAPKHIVFLGASAALIASTALAIFLGSVVERYAVGAPLKLIAGIGFLLIGAAMIAEHFSRGA